MVSPVKFGYAGKWSPNPANAVQAGYWVKSDPTPVGVQQAYLQTAQGIRPFFRVVTNQEYLQTAQNGQLVWSAMA
jgi:hypothetical protein